MHILVTADTLGGVWTYTRELVTGLVRRGEQVTLVSFGDIPTAAQAQYLEALIQEIKPDLLHFNQFYYGSLRCDVPRVVVAHSDVVSWWMSVHKKEPPETEWLRWYRQIVARGLSHATAVVAPSRWMLDQVELHYAKPAFGSVIYNGRTALLFNPHISKEENIVTVGRLWDSGKNVGLLLRQELPAAVRIVG